MRRTHLNKCRPHTYFAIPCNLVSWFSRLLPNILTSLKRWTSGHSLPLHSWWVSSWAQNTSSCTDFSDTQQSWTASTWWSPQRAGAIAMTCPRTSGSNTSRFFIFVVYLFVCMSNICFVGFFLHLFLWAIWRLLLWPVHLPDWAIGGLYGACAGYVYDLLTDLCRKTARLYIFLFCLAFFLVFFLAFVSMSSMWFVCIVSRIYIYDLSTELCK